MPRSNGWQPLNNGTHNATSFELIDELLQLQCHKNSKIKIGIYYCQGQNSHPKLNPISVDPVSLIVKCCITAKFQKHLNARVCK